MNNNNNMPFIFFAGEKQEPFQQEPSLHQGFSGSFSRGFQTKTLSPVHEPVYQQEPSPPQGFSGSFSRGFQTTTPSPIQSFRPMRGGHAAVSPRSETKVEQKQLLFQDVSKLSLSEPRKQRKPFYPIERPVSSIFDDDAKCEDFYNLVVDNDEDIFATTDGGGLPLPPIENWEDAELNPILLNNIVQLSKYSRPRNIQAYVMAYFFEDFDIKGHAETGTGKTAAFLIPTIHKISKFEPRKKTLKPRPYCIIVVPTRELCQQIYDQARKLSHGLNVRVCKTYGELLTGPNLRELNDGCDILIACPGRLERYVKNTIIELKELLYFILDEADSLLDPNDYESVKEIMQHPSFPDKENRHVMLFSATFPPEIQELGDKILRPKNVFISNKNYVACNRRIIQQVLEVAGLDKRNKLLEILSVESEGDFLQHEDEDSKKPKTVLVFVEQKRETDSLALFLTNHGINAQSFSGDRLQSIRQEVIDKFRSGTIDVMVTTDVCSRGIDIKDLDHVINFDMPKRIDTYVHRIGRTGRIRLGIATSFFDPNRDANIAEALIQQIKMVEGDVPSWLKEFALNRCKIYTEQPQK